MDGKTTPEQTLLRDMDVVRRIQQNLASDDTSTLIAVENMAHLVRTYGVLYDTVTDLLAPYELSFAQFNLLIILYKSPNRHLQMSEIGERMSVTRTNITKLVDCLERSGLVRRADQPGDRRVVLAELTDAGSTLMQSLVPRYFDNIRRLWAYMEPEDCMLLTHLLLKLRDSLKANREIQGALKTTVSHAEDPGSVCSGSDLDADIDRADRDRKAAE